MRGPAVQGMPQGPYRKDLLSVRTLLAGQPLINARIAQQKCQLHSSSRASSMTYDAPWWSRRLIAQGVSHLDEELNSCRKDNQPGGDERQQSKNG